MLGFGERECGREPAQLSGGHGVATGGVTRLPKFRTVVPAAVADEPRRRAYVRGQGAGVN